MRLAHKRPERFDEGLATSEYAGAVTLLVIPTSVVVRSFQTGETELPDRCFGEKLASLKNYPKIQHGKTYTSMVPCDKVMRLAEIEVLRMAPLSSCISMVSPRVDAEGL